MIRANELVIEAVCRRGGYCSAMQRRGGGQGWSVPLFNNWRLHGLIGKRRTVSSLRHTAGVFTDSWFPHKQADGAEISIPCVKTVRGNKKQGVKAQVKVCLSVCHPANCLIQLYPEP